MKVFAALFIGWFIGMMVASLIIFHYRSAPLRPLSEVKLGEDTHPDQRLGKAVAAADIGFGLPCAVYRNGPDHPVRHQTVVFWCANP